MIDPTFVYELILSGADAGTIFLIATAVLTIIGAIFAKSPEDQITSGPRIEGDQVQTESSYGIVKPIGFGQVPGLPGNIIAAGPIEEEIVTESETISTGGFFGLFAQKFDVINETFLYRQSVRVAYAETEFPNTAAPNGRRAALMKLRLGENETVFVASADGDGFKKLDLEFVMFDGAEDQLPWDIEEEFTSARTGVPNSAPAYRGLASIGFPHFLLNDYGRQFPQTLAEWSFTGGTPKSPTTIYLTSAGGDDLPDTVVFDPLRRVVFAYAEQLKTYRLELFADAITATFITPADQIDGGEAINVDLEGFFYLGTSGGAPTGQITRYDPYIGVGGVSTQDVHHTPRVSELTVAPFWGIEGRWLFAVSGSTSNATVRVYEMLPTDGGGLMIPIWDNKGVFMEKTPITSDVWGARWRRSPVTPTEGKAVEVWLTSDSTFTSNSPVILTRVHVVGIANENEGQIGQVLDLVGSLADETAIRHHFDWSIATVVATDWIPGWTHDEPHLCYVDDDDTFIAVGNGDLIKVGLPAVSPLPNALAPRITLEGTLTAADLGFTGGRVVGGSRESFMSYAGTGLLLIHSTTISNVSEFALIDPVTFTLAKRPGTNLPATYTQAELGLTDDIRIPIYDPASHSVILRMGTVDYRRVFLDRRDPLDADLADIAHALSNRGPDWDVAGPGLRSSWNGTAHTDAEDQIDVSALDGIPVRGFSIRNASIAKAAVQQLTEFFPEVSGHYWVETDFKARAKLLGAANVFALTDADLVVTGDEGGKKDPLDEQLPAEREFPRRLLVEYLDVDLDGEPNTAVEKRHRNPVNAVFSSLDRRESYPISAISAEAKTVAKRALARAWSEERSLGWVHTMRHLALDPGDPGTITTGGIVHQVRIGSTEVGNDHTTRAKGVTNDADAFILPVGIGSPTGGFVPPGPVRATITDFELIDAPLVRAGQASPGLYVLPLVTDLLWEGANWQRSDDGSGYTSWYSTEAIAIWGRASLLPDAPPGLDLVNTLDVTIPAGLNTAPGGSGWGSVLHTLTNPGFETGDLTGWTEVLTAGYTNWQVLASLAGATKTINPAEGSWFVLSNVDATQTAAELFQDHDAASAGVPTADFDAGLVEVVVSWRQNSFGSGNDTGGIRIEFWDGDPTGAGSLLATSTSPARSSPDNDWLVLEHIATAPAGTRWYRLVIVFIGTRVGANIDIYADQLSIESREVGSVFEAATDAQMEAGANRFILGFEIGSFGVWEYLGANVYRLSRLLRGLACTENATGSHYAGELFVLADDRLGRGLLPANAVGTTQYFRSVSIVSGARSPVESLFYVGRDLLACAPSALFATRAPWHGDVLLRWDPVSAAGGSYQIDLLSAVDGSVFRTYNVGRQPIEIGGTEASTVDFEHMTVATVTHVLGAVGNGDFETGDFTGWTPTHTPASLDVDTLAPRQSVGNHAPYEGTYLMRLDGTTSDSIAGIQRVVDLVGDGVAAFDLDNEFAMLEVRWRQAGFNSVRDPVRCEIEWIGSGNATLEGMFALDKTFIKTGFHAGAVSTGTFGTTTPGKRLLLETAALSEARGTQMSLGIAPSGGATTVNIERNVSAIGALWTVADGATQATFGNVTADVFDENDTASLDGVTSTAPSADLAYQIAFRDLEVFELDVVATFTLPEDLPGASATAATPPSGGSVVYAIRKNGTSLGTITFADGVSVATFSFAASGAYALGDRLTITAPDALFGMAGVIFSLPTVVQGGILKDEASPTLSVAADVWTLRTFASRSPVGARTARVRLVGVELDTSDPSPSVDAFLDAIEIRTVDAGIWRTLREAGETANFAPMIPGQLLYQTDLEGANEGFFELVSVTLSPSGGDAIEMFHYIDPAAGTVDDTTGFEEESWTMYGEQVRVLLADITAAGYTRDDPIEVVVVEVRAGRRGRSLTGTV